VIEKILRIGRGVKVRRARAKEICDQGLNGMDVDMKVELIQALIPIGLWHVKEELEEEVRSLAGEALLGRRDGDLFGSSGGMVVCPERADPDTTPGREPFRGKRSFGHYQSRRPGIRRYWSDWKGTFLLFHPRPF
jgi:hypothetical protein